MTRHVWPHAVLLHCAELLAAHELGLTTKIANKVLPKGGKGHGPAVALRWSTHPALGFPRAPFQVYRGVPDYKPDRALIDGPQGFAGQAVIPLPGDELFELRFELAPVGTVVAEALDAQDRPIPGQRIVFTSAGVGALRCPGIAALRLTGSGDLLSCTGMTAGWVANNGNWQRIAVVGLPYVAGELPPPVYDADVPQGYEPPSLPGNEAAIVRLSAEAGLDLPLPDTAIPTIPTPPWPSLDPVALVQQIRDGLLPMISHCLDQSNDADPNNQQVAFQSIQVVDGIRQVDQPLPPGADPATVGVPVVAITQLAVSADSEAATALGYGLTDFPPTQEKQPATLLWPPGLTPPPHLHMVEAVFRFPSFGEVLIAALAQVRPPPGPAEALTALTALGNRAPAADLQETAAVELGWNLASPPVAYVLAVSRAPGSSVILNAERVAAPGHDLFVPQRLAGPDGQPVPGTRTRFVDPAAPVPFEGSETSTYLVLARDVFSRWATWSTVSHALTAPAVTAPGLNSVALAASGTPVGALVPSTLTIEVAWDWSDRSPAQIELTGCFYPVTDPPPASYLLGLERDVTASGDPKIVLTFDADRDPVVPPAATWQAYRISPPGDERCVYRVLVPDMSCDYTGGSTLTYAVYARGYEAVRPASASALVGPRTAQAADPRPAPAPALPPILWTALPDATGTARALLTWAASVGGAPATGYFVWEATETALRAAVGLPPIAAPAPGVVSKTLPERASELRDHIDASPVHEQQSLVAFTRLDPRASPRTSRELELPGSADTLYVYRISTITAAGVESGRGSHLAFVGVPRRAVPGEPSLLLRRAAGAVRIYAIRGGGQLPAGYAVHRVRNPRAVAEVGLMGPPIHLPTSGLWQAPAPNDPALRGTDLTQIRVLEDPVPASWDDLYYRIVAVGLHDPANGIYSGRSRASALQSIVCPPANPPLLDQLTYTAPGGSRVLGFRTDLPVRTCSLGQATIAVSELDTSGPAAVRSVLLAITADAVPVGGPFPVIPAPTPAQLAAMPEISRSVPDAEGRATYSVRLPGGTAILTITVTDPLGRTAELTVPEGA